MPQIGGYTDNPNYWWQPRGSIIKPHLFDVTLAPHGLRIELVPTDHAAALRITFPSNTDNSEKRFCFREGHWESHSELLHSDYIIGKASQVNMDRMHFDNFNLFISTRSTSSSAARVESVGGGGICYRYNSQEREVIIHIATSLISHQQAKYNLESELDGKTFDEVKEETRLVWNKLLNRVDIVDPGPITAETTKYLIIFYTGLYRALMFPRRLDEKDYKTGDMVHFSPYDPAGQVHQGPLVTDNGFWDTFRTVYPLLGLAYRGELGFIIEGWLNAYREGGWLPSWASPGYRNCMVGTYADVVISDAIVKNIPGFDLEVARTALKRDAFEEPPPYAGSAIGKEGLNQYSQNGFMVSNGNAESVSRSLDFGFADFSTARAFEHLNQDEIYLSQHRDHSDELREDLNKLDRRWQRAVESCFSPKHGLMAPKSAGGNVMNFDPIEWGNGFVEGNSWHHSFPPYALNKLATLYGSEKKLLAKLHELMSTTSDFRVGSYHQEIHEMTEMRTLAMGQYGHNNQPSHHILYLFAQLGEVELTEQYVREVINRGYGPDFYAGDEDNGEQGAWFVLSALGLFSTTPGTPDYVLTTPLFKHVVIHRTINSSIKSNPSKTTNQNIELDDFHVIAMNAESLNIHTQKILLNGKLVTSSTLSDYDISSGGVLQFFIEDGSSSKIETLDPFNDVEISITQAREKQQMKDSVSAIKQQSEKQKEDFQKEIEKQQRLINSLTSELSSHLQEQHGNPEPTKLIAASTPFAVIDSVGVESNGKGEDPNRPCTAIFTQLELGLGFIAVNLCIISLMLGIQIYRTNPQPSQQQAGNYSFLRTITCCCNPVMISQWFATKFGTTLYSVVGKPNKRDTYTV